MCCLYSNWIIHNFTILSKLFCSHYQFCYFYLLFILKVAKIQNCLSMDLIKYSELSPNYSFEEQISILSIFYLFNSDYSMKSHLLFMILSFLQENMVFYYYSERSFAPYSKSSPSSAVPTEAKITSQQ